MRAFDRFCVIDPVLEKEDCIAIGEVPFSGNLLAIVVRGERAGEIVRIDHDRELRHSSSLARTLDDFLQLLCEKPARLLHDLGCYTRYADGVTDHQWIPIQYVADIRILKEDDIKFADEKLS